MPIGGGGGGGGGGGLFSLANPNYTLINTRWVTVGAQSKDMRYWRHQQSVLYIYVSAS